MHCESQAPFVPPAPPPPPTPLVDAKHAAVAVERKRRRLMGKHASQEAGARAVTLEDSAMASAPSYSEQPQTVDHMDFFRVNMRGKTNDPRRHLEEVLEEVEKACQKN